MVDSDEVLPIIDDMNSTVLITMLPISRPTEEDAMQSKETCWDCWYPDHVRWGGAGRLFALVFRVNK